MEIEISGHSGCKIDIANGDEGLFIVKSTNDPPYVSRLRSQALKQKSFEPPKNSSIKAPRIIDLYWDDACCRVKMEYVYALNSIGFMENAGFEQINNFLENIIDFVAWEISRSELRKIDDAVFIDKYRDVQGNLSASRTLAGDNVIRSWFPRLEEIFTQNPFFQIPVGPCHGDLTFSNILFSRNSFYLIDFLDSFIETPLLDIVKLRQDTAFNWSGLMYSGTYDKVRHEIVLKFMDQKIDESFLRYPWYRDSYGVFQLMNFLRILQYAREPRIVDFLKDTITLLLDRYGK